MNARGRFLSGLITMVIALAGFVTVGALPAAAAPKAVQYVALGDSYAAGTALGSSPDDCQHGDGGYPALLSPGSRIDLQANGNIACSGATISAVVANQLPALKALNGDTRLVTLTVGAADLELSRVLTTCTTGTLQACLAEIAGLSGGLEELADNLPVLFAEVADAAPRARIVVTGYPHLFEPTATFVDPRVIIAVNQATDELNAIIERSVAAANDADVNIHYVDVTEEFSKHGIVKPITNPNAFIHSLFNPFACDPPRTDCPDPEAFHPTLAGYGAYADAISAALPGGWLDKQKQSV
jgi:lysophospholipase L1-like esterase